MFPKIIKTSKVTADMICNEDLILYEIQKDEVEKSDYSRITQLFNELNKAKIKGRSKIVISFAYNDDTRELYEIPEVVKYIKDIFKIFPHLVYFLLPNQQTLLSFIFCLIDAKVLSKSNEKAQINVDESLFKAKLNEIADYVKTYGEYIDDIEGANKVLHEFGIKL